MTRIEAVLIEYGFELGAVRRGIDCGGSWWVGLGGIAVRRVIIESPYAGEVAVNVAYARAAVRDCLARGEAPIVSHLLFTQPGILNDDIPEERKLGIEAGLAWGPVADATVVYMDRGLSPGVQAGIARAVDEGRPVEYRTIAGWS